MPPNPRQILIENYIRRYKLGERFIADEIYDEMGKHYKKAHPTRSFVLRNISSSRRCEKLYVDDRHRVVYQRVNPLVCPLCGEPVMVMKYTNCDKVFYRCNGCKKKFDREEIDYEFRV